MKSRTKKERAFIRAVKAFYTKEGRHNLPWRKTTNPYSIVVSEVMLQQTQVERVIPKYKEFVKQFPTVQVLARAPLRAVLIGWQGLGYNRRARMLHECAKEVVRAHKGIFPKTYADLVNLPGIGPYTAGAVMAFSYNEAVPMIETNIRSVYLHHFFKDKKDIPDTELMPIIERTLDVQNPRVWYWALMDYGTYLKRVHGNQNRRSKHYKKQSKFKGSDRQIRGAVLRQLTEHSATFEQLHERTAVSKPRLKKQLEKLAAEGLITTRTQKGEARYTLPT